jgi:hypothetical protein
VARSTKQVRGALGPLALLVTVAGTVVALILLCDILFVVFNANPTNTIVSHMHSWGRALVGPFAGLFTPRNPKQRIAINWGIAAAVYFVASRLVARLLSAL